MTRSKNAHTWLKFAEISCNPRAVFGVHCLNRRPQTLHWMQFPPDTSMASVLLSWSPPMRLVRRCAPALLLFLGPATVRADSPVTTVPPLPPALTKLAPETLDDLKAIQEQTKAVLKKA